MGLKQERDTGGDGKVEREPLDLIVTNFNRNFTGVSATAAAVVARQIARYNLHLAGRPLPGCPKPVSLRAAISLTRQSVRHRPVIWHVRRNSEMLAAIAARDLLRLPIKTVFTSSAQRLHSAFPRWLISRMDAIIATTERAASFFSRVSAIAPHGVDTERFRPAANRLDCWAHSGFPGTMGIGTVGRIRPEKGTDIFVEAMIRLLPSLPGARALVIGRAASEHRAFEKTLMARVSAAGLENRILFTGEIPPEKLAGLLPGLSLLVAAPRYEGYGMTVLEAMACGVPVIASNTGYFAGFIGNSDCGHIADPNNAETIAALAMQMLSSENRIEASGKTARDRVVKHFSVDGEIEAIDRVYRSLCGYENKPGGTAAR